MHEHGVGGGLGAEHPDGARRRFRATSSDARTTRRAAVGERTAVEELERVGDVGALEHRVERDLLPELRLGIERAVAVVLHGHVGHLLLGRPVLVHVGAGDEREDAGEGQADGLLVARRRSSRRSTRWRRRSGMLQHALGAADEDDVGDARADLHDGVTEGRVAGGAGVLEAGGRDGRQAQERRGERAHVQLLLTLAAGDIAVVERLDRRRGDRRRRGWLRAAASAKSSALVRSCLPNLVTPTPMTATRRIDPPGLVE